GADAPGGGAEHVWCSRIHQRLAEVVVWHGYEESARLELRVVRQGFGTEHRGVGKTAQLRGVDEIGDAVAACPGVEHVEQMRAMFPAIVEVRPGRFGEILRLAIRLDPLDQRRPVSQCAMHDVAVEAAGDAKISRPVETALAR